MAKAKSAYICSECGYESPKWYGKCPCCGEWNTMNEELVTPVVKKVPQTGERSNIPLWLSIAGTSAGVAATAIIAKRKKKI